MRTLEAEAKGTQVGVCIVYPMGAIDTPANRKDMPNADPRTWIDPAEIAGQQRSDQRGETAHGR